MQQVDDPPSLPVGTEVSAKYKGAFCEAKVSKVVRNIKVKVAYKQGLGSGIVSDDDIKAASGQLRVGASVEVRHPDRKDYVEATVTKIQDCSQYTVVFDDGDITTLRRTALCLKSGRHFNESETLDQLPLTHPEHFGNPVVGGRRGRRRGQMNEDSSDDDDESDAKEVVNEKEEHIGKVVCIETESKKKDKEKWFPGLVVAPTAQATVRIRVKDEYLVRSFKDGRYYTVPKKEANEFTREAATKQDGPAVQAALEYLDSDVLPAHWDRDALFGLSNTSSEDEGEMDSDSSDDEPREEKDHFVAQLYKYMDDRGTPLNKVPSIQSRDVDLYRLFRAVQKRGGYNRVTAQNQWKSIALRLGFTPVTVSVTNLVKQAYKKFLQPYGEFHRKLGCSMLMTPRNSNRSKGRSLVRANSVASPKPADTSKESSTATTSKLATNPVLSNTSAVANTSVVSNTASANSLSSTAAIIANSATEESENTSESSVDISKNRRKTSVGSGIAGNGGKVKGLIEKYEEKMSKDDGDVPLSKIKAAAINNSREREKDDGKEKDRDISTNPKDAPTNSGQVTRDSSPSGLTVSGKKEKHQRKQSSQNEDKRGKRKKDEIVVEKIDTGDFIVEIGDKLKVYYHEKKVTYEAKVIEIAVQRGTPMYLVHYTGWNNRYDEWVPRERIAENLTKGGKHKARTSSTGGINEKSKENPPKPPNTVSLTSSSVVGSNNTLSSTSSGPASVTTSKNVTTTAKRGRGRSDSLPPRSTTPSSVASNSSRTKSPATSTLKKRPQRQITSNIRRTSVNVSDVSMPTESDTDSDEPVRRPTRAAKEPTFKGGPSHKALVKSKISASAPNSQSDTDDNEDEDDDDEPTTSRGVGRKGRDYDLNQIRSELKGFQGLKSPSPTGGSSGVEVNSASKEAGATTIKVERGDSDLKPAAVGGDSVAVAKKEPKVEPKDEPSKSSSTELSSETDSFGDDDSQSSDKTTTLENMTKKFQQKINADKQRALEKPQTGKSIVERAPLGSTRVVEKIIKEREAEKRQESLKAKPSVKEEIKPTLNIPAKMESESNLMNTEIKEEDKKVVSSAQDTKPSLIAPARFGTNAANIGKYTSVIVEKPLNVAKKTEGSLMKKVDIPKKAVVVAAATEPGLGALTKKFVEPAVHKDILKVESPAACSPSSTSSTSSSSSLSSSSSSTSNSRSLPDMSKLDISGTSTASQLSTSVTSSSCAGATKDLKYTAVSISKPISPDVYEFKDTEPFEFEIRKSSITAAGSASVITANLSASGGGNVVCTTGARAKQGQGSKIEYHAQVGQHSMSTLMNRKKRGSPMKESVVEKAKQMKLEEKGALNPLLADAKLLHHPLPVNAVSGGGSSLVKSPLVTQSKASMHGQLSKAASPSPAANVTPQKSEATPFDALRKSPSFNLNINALNEELAQTVQETTRALTDVLQTPLPPPVLPASIVGETTPTKQMPVVATASITTAESSLLADPTASTSKLATPPSSGTATSTKPTVGSPFIETRKDLSNVFELSFGAGVSSRENKFELENAKILLSATAGAFDLDPAKYESSKPTPSIADKVLKAISQKKEEVENKNRETKQETLTKKEVNVGQQKDTDNSGSSPLSGMKQSKTESPSETAVTVSALCEPLKVSTELPTSSNLGSSAVIGSSLTNFEKLLSSKRTSPLTSPEPKLGILESIGAKNHELTETIQKLECAIQRRTPVTSHPVTPTTPLSTIAPEVYSEESNDSTDSEQRLVIEDVEEPGPGPAAGAEQKSPVVLGSADHTTKPAAPVKLDVGGNQKLSTPQHDIPAPIPIKVVSSGGRTVQQAAVTTLQSIGTSELNSLPTNIVNKLSGNTAAVVYQLQPKTVVSGISSTAAIGVQQATVTKAATLLLTSVPQSPVSVMDPMAERNGALGHITNTIPSSVKGVVPARSSNMAGSATVVPIELPDIPVSVVVASSAVPSVMAAAQAAAAALKSPKIASQKQQHHLQQQQQQQQQAAPPQHHVLSNIKLPVTSTLDPSSTVATAAPVASTATIVGLKSFETAKGPRAVHQPGKAAATLHIQTPQKNTYHQSSAQSSSAGGTSTSSSTSGFYLDPRTELRPEDGLKPLTELQRNTIDKSGIISGGNPSSGLKEVYGDASGVELSALSTSDAHSDSINQLLCEETIPGSPAPVGTGKDESQDRTASLTPLDHVSEKEMSRVSIVAQSHLSAGSAAHAILQRSSGSSAVGAVVAVSSSPNDSASQEDESSEDLKKAVDVENEVTPRKRRRTRKQSEMTAMTSEQSQSQSQQQQPQPQHQPHQPKRRRQLTCAKKNTAGSDSEDNSDNISQRSATHAARQQHQHQHQHQQQHLQQQQQQNNSSGTRPCPYNFLVQLDPSLSPDQCIAILLKQIQDLRKTYNIIKGDLASIDRRRKKLRRREREKKQQMQNQQQMKIGS